MTHLSDDIGTGVKVTIVSIDLRVLGYSTPI